MRILSLNISTTNTGWAFFIKGKLVDSGNIKSPSYYAGLTKNNLLMGQALYWYCKQIKKLVTKLQPSKCCAEDINISRPTIMRSMAQFHAAASIAISIYNSDMILEKVHNATMRSQLGLNTNVSNAVKEEVKKQNKKINKTDSKIANMCYILNEKYQTDEFDWKEIKKLSKTSKQKPLKVMTVTVVNILFGLDLKMEEHDRADAIAIGYTYHKKGE